MAQANVPPIAVANIALFVQEKGSVVRDLAYSFDVDGYQGNDLTILANHLFQKHSIVDWCFSIVPYSSAFCIRDDGKLLVMTYLRDQQVLHGHHNPVPENMKAHAVSAKAMKMRCISSLTEPLTGKQ